MLFLNEQDCINFLESKGYYVYKFFDVERLPRNALELVKYFFSKARIIYNIDYTSIIWKVEASYSKTFIKQLSQNTDSLDKLAILKAKYVIDTVFDNIDLFGIYYEFTSLKILAAESGSWVVRKCFELDKNKINKRTGYTQEDWESLYKEYEKVVYEKPNIEKVKSELVNILGDNYGKEKTCN